MFGKCYVLSDAAPCCFSQATLGEFSATSGSPMTNGESPVFIRCMVLEIQLFFLIPSSKASCFPHLVEDVQKNGYISRTTECINTGLSPLCF